MVERVVEQAFGVRWDPNAPDIVTVSDGTTLAVAARAHPDDEDGSSVVLCWGGVTWSCMGVPNDEALPLHRLYGCGLSEIVWAGRVEGSDLIRTLAPMVHDATGLTHHIVVFKEGLLEVVARTVMTRRSALATREAAVSALAY